MKTVNLFLIALPMALLCEPLVAQDNPAASPTVIPTVAEQSPPAAAPASVAAAAQSAPAEPAAAATADAPKPVERTIRFQFDGIPYLDVLTRFAQMANKPLLTDATVEGTITFNDPHPYAYAEAMETLNLILSMKGVMLVETERHLRLITLKELPQMPLRILRGLDKTGDAKPGEVVTVVLSLQNLEAPDVAQAVSSMLSNAGSVAPLSRGRGLIITDRLGNITRIRDLLNEIDTASPAQRQMRAYTLVHSSGAVVADLINKTFGTATAPKRVEFNQASKRYEALPADPIDYVTAVFDEASRTLVMYGPIDRITLAETLIKRFEDQSGSRVGEVRIFFPRSISAQELARMVREAISGVAEEREPSASAATKARLIVDMPTNRLIVSAPMAGQLDAIDKLVTKIDATADPKAEATQSENVQVTKIFRSKWADPDTLARLLSDGLSRPPFRPRDVPPFRVTVDPKTRDLILMGIPGDVQQAIEIATQLDSNQPAPRVLQTLPLKTSRPSLFAQILRQAYLDQAKNQPNAGAPDATILGDDFNSRLIVTATESQLKLIEELVKQLDSEAERPTRQLKAIVLKHMSANSVANIVSQLFSRQADDPSRRVIVTASADDSTLVVEAREANLARIEDLVRTLDLEPARGTIEVRTYHLVEANAADLAPTLARLFAERQDPRRRAADTPPQPRFEVDVTGNVLMVAATKEQMENIDKLIEELRTAVQYVQVTKIFRCQWADPDTLARILSDALAKPASRPRTVPAFKVTVDPKTKDLIFMGSPGEIQQATEIATQLDSNQPAPRVLKTIALKSSRASEFALRIRQLYQDQVKNQPGAGTADAVILGDDFNSRLIVTATEPQLKILEDLVKQLDTDADRPVRQVKAFVLKHTSAASVSAMITQLFGRQSDDPARRVVVTASNDDQTLVLEAPESALGRIEEMIRALDLEPARGTLELRTYHLVEANATELAPTLARLFAERQDPRRRESETRPQPRFEADSTANVLMVAATKEQLQQIDQLIKELRTRAEVAGEIRTFVLQHSDAAQMIQLLETMLREDTAPAVTRGSSRGTLIQRGPSGEISRLRIAAAPALNAIVIQGSPQRLGLAEQLINSLDRAETISASIIQMVHLKKSQAEMVADAVNKAVTARGPQAGPKRVNVTPVVGSNSLIVEGAPADVKNVMQIIQGLDEESSGGEIEVHIYKLENGKAREVSRMLNQILQGVPRRLSFFGRGGGGGRDGGSGGGVGGPRRDITVTEDERTNSLIISATAADFKLIQQILPTLDQKPDRPDRDVSFVSLLNADAFDVAMKIESLYSDRPRADRVVVEADSNLNSITIMARRADMAEIENLVQRLDSAALDTSTQIRMETLDKVPAEQIARMLLNLYPQMYQRQIKVVDKLPTRPGDTLQERTAPPDSTNAPPAKTTSPDATGAQKPEDQESPPVVMAVDKTANVLIFSGPSRELKQIHSIIFELTSSFVSNDAEFRQFPLKEADPVAAARTLSELFRPEPFLAGQGGAQARGPGRRPVQAAPTPQAPPQPVPAPGQPGQVLLVPSRIAVVAEPRTRSLIVRARPSDFSLLETLIRQLDVPGVSSQIEFRLIELKNAHPDKLLPLVTQMITQLNLARPADPLTVIKDPRGGALFVVARAVLLDQVEKLVRDLDTPADFAEAEILIVPLKNARAPQLAATLHEMLKPGATGEVTPTARELQEQVRRLRVQNDQGVAVVLDLTQPIKIMADPLQAAPGGSNRLILASTPDNLKALSAVVEMMDTTSPEGLLTEVKVFRLKYASATRLVPLLQSVFAESAPTAGTEALRIQVSRLQTLLGRNGPRTTERPSRRQAVLMQADDTTNVLIVAARSDIMPLIEDVIRTLDIPAASGFSTIRLYPLQHADAAVIQKLINDLYRGPNANQIRNEDRPNVTLDDRTNTLIVSGNENAFAIIASLLDRLDRELPGGEIRLVALRHAAAQTLSATLTTLFTQRYQGARTSEAQRNRPIIISDPRSNSLLIAANPEENRALDQLLEKLDRPPDNPAVVLTVIGLRHNDSARAASMIQSVFAARRQSLTIAGQPPTPQDQVHVEPDSLSNSLVISANPENLELIRGLLAKIDVEPTAAEGLIQIFPLKQADAQRAATMLRALMDQGIYRPGLGAGGRGRSGRDALAVTVDQRSNTLIVSASPENLIVVKELIKQLDSHANADTGNIQLYTLKHAKASQLASVLEQFFRSKRAGESVAGAAERSVPVTVTADDRTNTLLITGGKEIFEMVDRMIAQLDSKEIVAKTSFRVIPLKQATAGKLQATLTQLFLRRPSAVQGQPPDPITVVADSWANALIVAASPEDLVMVEALVAQLDSGTGDVGVEVQVIQLAKADARRVSQTVQTLYRSGGPGTASPVTVNVDERLNALVVSAGQSDLKRIAELVKKLDTDQVANVSEIRIFPLVQARATQLAAILTSILNTKPASLTEQSPSRQSLLQFITRTAEGKDLVASALKEGVLITPDPRTNSLIVSAPLDYMTLLEQLITRLDASLAQAAKIRVFHLKNADARQMSTILTTLFRLQRTATQAANDQTVEYSLVKPAPNPDAPEELKLEETASATFGTHEDSTLTLTVDLRTNSLIVGGAEHYVALASEIIQTLDSSPAQERQAEVYRLKNSRAPDVEGALRNFLRQDQQLISAAVGSQAMAQELLEKQVSIVAETNSNALLISASPRYFVQVKSLIEQLDQPQLQVLIQVLLAEVTLDATSELGVDWSYQSMGTPQFSTGQELGAAEALKNFGGFSSGVTGSNFSFMLRALESEGRLQVLSRPQILTADNQEALVNIGQQVPLITDARVTQFGDSINSVQYRNVGVELRVTPRISPDGFVKMDVGPRISQLTSSDVDLGRGAKAPIINERSATTTVSVQSGQSILIGGLISTTDDTRANRTPFLGRIPYLGALFRSHKKIEDRKELLIILTPQVLVKAEVIAQTRDASAVTREQLDRATINEEFNRDPLQRQILDPLYPNRPTNSPALKPAKRAPRN